MFDFILCLLHFVFTFISCYIYYRIKDFDDKTFEERWSECDK